MSDKYISQIVIGETLPDGRILVKVTPFNEKLTDFELDDGSTWRLSERTECRPDGFMGAAADFPPTKLAPAPTMQKGIL